MPETPTKPQGVAKKFEMVFNNETLCRLEIPSSIDLQGEWKKFLKDHSHVSEKKAYPSMFCGDLVNKMACKQLAATVQCDEKANFKF